jgi:hypothetical protein
MITGAIRTTMVITSTVVLTPRELFQWQEIYSFVRWLNTHRRRQCGTDSGTR